MPRYIDAEKLERFFKRDEWNTPDERWRPESEFGRFVDCVPTEDAVPVKHAQWIEDGYCFSYDLVCSYCGFNFAIEDSILEHFNYCPYCGAKMDGIKE